MQYPLKKLAQLPQQHRQQLPLRRQHRLRQQLLLRRQLRLPLRHRLLQAAQLPMFRQMPSTQPRLKKSFCSTMMSAKSP